MIGRSLIIDGESRQVIGIMPRSFRFMDRDAALFLPLQLNRGEAFIGNFSYQASHG